MELSSFWFGAYKLVKFSVYPLTWLFLTIGSLVVVSALPVSLRRFRWIRYLAASSLLIVYIFASPISSRLMLGLIEQQAPLFDSATTKRFDAIVVLGGGVAGKGTLRPSNELSPSSLERTICGADLFAHGFAPRIIFAGGDASIFGEGPKEGVEMKRLALRLGIPEAAIIVEDRSRTTYENAVETKRIMGNGSILMVTSASHVPRALGLFHKQGIDAVPYPCGYYVQDRPEDEIVSDPFDLLPEAEALRRSTLAINEIAGTLLYRAAGKL
jgi:uncharacterized SAM-binding protein YcdF (DUF218 family)